ncbi:MAG: transposase [Desulfovibrio sp.]|nr:transposase [Desulfovibrio sp.]
MNHNKYRKPILAGDIAYRTREMIRDICRQEGVEILKGYIKDHIHFPLTTGRGHICCRRFTYSTALSGSCYFKPLALLEVHDSG